MKTTDFDYVELPDHVALQMDDQTLLRIFSGPPNYSVSQKDGKIIFQGKDWTYFLPKDWEVVFDTDEEDDIYVREHIITIYNGDKLAQYLSCIPYGIINKFITGIGATTVELRSERNSIIVVPAKSLAFTKNKQFPDSLYVGSTIEDCVTSPTDEEIAAYIGRIDIYKKILVVADSLPRVLNTIGKENYPDYFYMIDEIDTIQMDSYFRPKLEYVLDYYFEFPKEKRAMVSATVKPFSHPGLKYERRITYRYETMPQKNCSLVYTDNADLALAEELEFLHKTTKKKIVVAYNSPSRIMRIIQSLPWKLRKQCSVLCGEDNKNEMTFYNKRSKKEYNYYRELTGTLLETRITFITSAYFVGLDITEPFHLISAANADMPYTLLSLEKMIQIAGRCRCPQGILSDTMIYSIRKNKEMDMNEYTGRLHNTVNEILDLFHLLEKYTFIALRIEEIKADIKTRIQEILPGESDPVPLIRQDIHGNYQKSYNNIDALTERQMLVNQLYSAANQLKEHLEAAPNVTVAYREKLYGTQSLPETPTAEINESKEVLDLKELQEEVIPALEAGVKIKVKDLKRKRSRIFLEAFWNLIPYISKEELIPRLIEESKDIRRLRNYSNAVKFRALASKHPLKVSIFSSFKKGEVYTRKEIHSKLCECFRTNGLRPPRDAEKSVRLLSTFFTINQKKIQGGSRKVLGKYSYRINHESAHKKIIPVKTSAFEVFDF